MEPNKGIQAEQHEFILANAVILLSSNIIEFTVSPPLIILLNQYKCSKQLEYPTLWDCVKSFSEYYI